MSGVVVDIGGDVGELDNTFFFLLPSPLRDDPSGIFDIFLIRSWVVCIDCPFYFFFLFDFDCYNVNK